MKAKTLKERITQFKSVHSDRYDYSLVVDESIRWNTKIKVICKTHGSFDVVVNNHHAGSGCPQCSHSKKQSLQERISSARSVHGDEYDYSKWPANISASTKVAIGCKTHGDFYQTIANHINHKSKCPKCSGNERRTLERFFEKAKSVHGDRYIYGQYDDVRKQAKVKITCRIHGDFTQSVGTHLAGKGCQSCGSNSVCMSSPAVVYILKSGTGFFKVGLSSNLDLRISQLARSTPFKFSVVHIKEFETRYEAAEFEKKILSLHDSAGFTGFDGCTEWRIGDINL